MSSPGAGLGSSSNGPIARSSRRLRPLRMSNLPSATPISQASNSITYFSKRWSPGGRPSTSPGSTSGSLKSAGTASDTESSAAGNSLAVFATNSSPRPYSSSTRVFSCSNRSAARARRSSRARSHAAALAARVGPPTERRRGATKKWDAVLNVASYCSARHSDKAADRMQSWSAGEMSGIGTLSIRPDSYCTPVSFPANKRTRLSNAFELERPSSRSRSSSERANIILPPTLKMPSRCTA